MADQHDQARDENLAAARGIRSDLADWLRPHRVMLVDEPGPGFDLSERIAALLDAKDAAHAREVAALREELAAARDAFERERNCMHGECVGVFAEDCDMTKAIARITAAISPPEAGTPPKETP